MLSEEYDALDERVSEIERSLCTAMEALTDLTSAPADEEAPGVIREEPGTSANGMLVRGFDPQAIAHPGARRQAWERLYAFVEQLNATWGALRSMNGMADYYVRARWWENPLTVSHLAALEAAYAEAYVSEDLPTVGTSLMLRVLEDTQRVLALVTGKARLIRARIGVGRFPLRWGRVSTSKMRCAGANFLRLSSRRQTAVKTLWRLPSLLPSSMRRSAHALPLRLQVS